MAKKTYLDNAETKRRVLSGISDLAAIVGATLGPGGRTIMLAQGDKPPLSTKDGVTVARHYKAKGDVEDIVALAALEVCERTNKSCGDGTTTAIVLAHALVDAGQDWLSVNEGYSPQKLARELKKIYQDQIRPQIEKLARPIKGLPKAEAKEVVRRVALVSANHDEEIADAVANAVESVGEDGMINAEEGTGLETKTVEEEGFPFESGLYDIGTAAGASFINRKDKGDCFIERAYVLLYDGEILDVGTISPILNQVHAELDGNGNQLKTPIVVIAHGFSDPVLKMMSQNFRQGVLTVLPIKTPSNGQNLGRAEFLHDVAAYVNAKVYDAQGAPLPSATIAALGTIDSVKINQNEGILLGQPEQALVEERIRDLKTQMEGATEFDKSKLRYRIGRLTGGIATIYAGGATALEAKERYARVVDAVSAVRSAMELGVVPGGGATLLQVARNLEGDGGVGEIFADALRKPFERIVGNAGLEDQVDSEEVGDQGQQKFIVYNALTGEKAEWWDGGIIDPAKVTITALENALSVAQLLMTLGGLIVEESSEGAENIRSMQEGLLKAMNKESF